MNPNFEWIDISPEVTTATGVFPGDTPFQREIQCDFSQGQQLLLSKIQTTPHIGAHADAPNHYHPNGVGIAARDLSYYYGSCQVISVQLPRGERIFPKHLGSTQILAPRVLFRTLSFPDAKNWNSDFNSLSPELIQFLGTKAVRLVGIDTPSVDLEDDPNLVTHQEIYRHDMAILEGLVLSHVRDGMYHLVALPLRWKDLDASPVRAILIPEEKNRKPISNQ